MHTIYLLCVQTVTPFGVMRLSTSRLQWFGTGWAETVGQVEVDVFTHRMKNKSLVMSGLSLAKCVCVGGEHMPCNQPRRGEGGSAPTARAMPFPGSYAYV